MEYLLVQALPPLGHTDCCSGKAESSCCHFTSLVPHEMVLNFFISLSALHCVSLHRQTKRKGEQRDRVRERGGGLARGVGGWAGD